MKIVNAKKQDAGLYKCEATNSVGSDEAETSVEVIEFVKPPEVLNTTEGADKLVECRVTTKPSQQTVKWLKSNDALPGLTDGTLQLTNIQQAADGKYTCSVSVGKLTFVAEMQLNVRGKCHDMGLTTFSHGRHIAGGQGLRANFWNGMKNSPAISWLRCVTNWATKKKTVNVWTGRTEHFSLYISRENCSSIKLKEGRHAQ